MNWEEAIEEAKDELGITGYTDNWNRVVETAKDILREERETWMEEEGIDPKKEYQEYLNSEEWKKLRLQALFRDDYKCLDCRKPATEVHHTTYGFQCGIAELELPYLMSLCRGCHKERTIIQRKIKRGERLPLGTKCNYCSEECVIILKKQPVCRRHWKLIVDGILP